MDVMDSIAITFKELIPNHNIPEKWREIVLNTGGTHSTLQDIKLPHKASGYWYKPSKKSCTRNRFIYWQTTPDAIELSEASLDINLTGCHLRCKVAAGTPPLNGMSVFERPQSREVVILVATVSSVHRLIFPHPEAIDRKSTFGSLSTNSPSIFNDSTTLAANNPNNYYIFSQASSVNGAVAHTCASLLRESGEAVFALAWGNSGDGGLLVVKLPTSGTAVTLTLKRESTVPRLLAGITGALRGRGGGEGVETCGVAVCERWVVAACGDGCLRAWLADVGGAPVAVSPPLSANPARPRPPPQGHQLQKTVGMDGSRVLVACLAYPAGAEFVVLRLHEEPPHSLKFVTICQLFGPQLDLLDYVVGYGDGNIAIWALWSQPDGETVITTSGVGAEAAWRAVAGREPPAPLPRLATPLQYRDRLMAVGAFPPPVIHKALQIYRRLWGEGEGESDGAGRGLAGEGGAEGREAGEVALAVVQARMRQLAARSATPDHAAIMHKCWSDLYSWCVQYMEGLQKPLGLMVQQHRPESAEACGWWCGVVRRAGVALVRELAPLEQLLLAPHHHQRPPPHTATPHLQVNNSGVWGEEGWAVARAGAVWEAGAAGAEGGGGGAEVERRVFACAAPQHRLLPRTLHLLHALHQDHPALMSPQLIDELNSILEPIRDLQNAVLEFNDALRLTVPDAPDKAEFDETSSEYENLFNSDIGVSIVAEAIRQMAEMRVAVVRGAVAALALCRGADGVPGAGHCVVHWQAYRALVWLAHAPTHPHHNGGESDELFRLKLSALGVGVASIGASVGAALGAGATTEGAVGAFARGAGGARARAHLAATGAPTACHLALPAIANHLAHQLWAVSGGFEFGWWLASINQPRLVQSYVALLEPWCEWNACSRQFILGLSLLDTGDAEGAYTAFCKAAKGVSTEPFLRQLIAAPEPPPTQHHALVLYYMKVIKLFEIHDAGACVVRLAETAISIADKNDPNLAMFQWVVFKWHVAGGRVERAIAAAVANPAKHARANAAATLLTTLAERKQLGALVRCAALAAEAERAAASRAKLLDARAHNPYYAFLYALHVHRNHYRKAAAVMYERAARCLAEGEGGGTGGAGGARRRGWLAAALCCLRLAAPEHAYLAAPAAPSSAAASSEPRATHVLAPADLAAMLRQHDPDAMDPLQKALQGGETLDMNALYPRLREADAQALHAVTKRVISTEQFLPHWALKRYMEVDGAGCVRTLLGGGRAVEAGEACAGKLRELAAALASATPPLQPRCSLLPVAELLLHELQQHLRDEHCQQAHEDLQSAIRDYVDIIKRKSEDMKLAHTNFPQIMP